MRVLIFLLLVSILSCSEGSEYLLMEKRELASGERHDSLLLGLHFGMERQAFFDHCYELNRQGVIKEGAGGAVVEYRITELPYPARINFYPQFDDNQRIYILPVSFFYDAWAPWNKAQWSDSLMVSVVSLMEDWYGGGFIQLSPEDVENKSVVYAKVDGNRRIAIFKEDDMKVKVVFTDLRSPMAKRNKKAKNNE